MNVALSRPKLVLTAAGSVPASVAAVSRRQSQDRRLVYRAQSSSLFRRRSGPAARFASRISDILVTVVPPLVMLALILLVWQIACSGPKATLPAPLKIWKEAYDLITRPFFVNGPQDIGLGWRVLTPLAARLHRFRHRRSGRHPRGRPHRTSRSGPCAASTRSSRCCARCRRLPGCPSRSPRSAIAQPSAIFVIFITSVWPMIINTAVGIRNIPQDYRNVAQVLRLNQLRILLEDHAARPRRRTSSRACASASASHGSPSLRLRC